MHFNICKSFCRQGRIAEKLKEPNEKGDVMIISNPCLLQVKLEIGF